MNIEAAQGTSFYKMVEYQQQVAEVVRKDPNIETFMTRSAAATTDGRVNGSQVHAQAAPRNVADDGAADRAAPAAASWRISRACACT